MSGTADVNVDAYLRRIGLGDGTAPLDASAAALARLHRAHVATIPFENLDPLRGVPVSLELGPLQDKLVTRRRGGYCFEQNTLLGAVARELGFIVTPMLGRVGPRTNPERGRTHLLLNIRDRDGMQWHADVGFGVSAHAGTPPEPLPFAGADESLRDGWRYRIERHGDELVLTTASAGGPWGDMYSFVPEPVAQIDIEMGNWWSCTQPNRARFTRLLVVASTVMGRRTLLTDADGALVLGELTPTAARTQPLAPDTVGAVLADRFGLDGWRWGPAGRPIPA